MVAIYFIVAYVAGALLCGFVADDKGRSIVGWILVALLCSPLLALLALAAIPSHAKSARPYVPLELRDQHRADAERRSR